MSDVGTHDAPVQHHGIGVNLRSDLGSLSDQHGVLRADLPLDLPIDPYAALERQLSLHPTALPQVRLYVRNVSRARRRQV